MKMEYDLMKTMKRPSASPTLTLTSSHPLKPVSVILDRLSLAQINALRASIKLSSQDSSIQEQHSVDCKITESEEKPNKQELCKEKRKRKHSKKSKEEKTHHEKSRKVDKHDKERRDSEKSTVPADTVQSDSDAEDAIVHYGKVESPHEKPPHEKQADDVGNDGTKREENVSDNKVKSPSCDNAENDSKALFVQRNDCNIVKPKNQSNSESAWSGSGKDSGSEGESVTQNSVINEQHDERITQYSDSGNGKILKSKTISESSLSNKGKDNKSDNEESERESAKKSQKKQKLFKIVEKNHKKQASVKSDSSSNRKSWLASKSASAWDSLEQKLQLFMRMEDKQRKVGGESCTTNATESLACSLSKLGRIKKKTNNTDNKSDNRLSSPMMSSAWSREDEWSSGMNKDRESSWKLDHNRRGDGKRRDGRGRFRSHENGSSQNQGRPGHDTIRGRDHKWEDSGKSVVSDHNDGISEPLSQDEDTGWFDAVGGDDDDGDFEPSGQETSKPEADKYEKPNNQKVQKSKARGETSEGHDNQDKHCWGSSGRLHVHSSEHHLDRSLEGQSDHRSEDRGSHRRSDDSKRYRGRHHAGYDRNHDNKHHNRVHDGHDKHHYRQTHTNSNGDYLGEENSRNVDSEVYKQTTVEGNKTSRSPRNESRSPVVDSDENLLVKVRYIDDSISKLQISDVKRDELRNVLLNHILCSPQLRTEEIDSLVKTNLNLLNMGDYTEKPSNLLITGQADSAFTDDIRSSLQQQSDDGYAENPPGDSSEQLGGSSLQEHLTGGSTVEGVSELPGNKDSVKSPPGAAEVFDYLVKGLIQLKSETQRDLEAALSSISGMMQSSDNKPGNDQGAVHENRVGDFPVQKGMNLEELPSDDNHHGSQDSDKGLFRENDFNSCHGEFDEGKFDNSLHFQLPRSGNQRKKKFSTRKWQKFSKQFDNQNNCNPSERMGENYVQTQTVSFNYNQPHSVADVGNPVPLMDINMNPAQIMGGYGNPLQQMGVGVCNPQQQMDVGMCNPQQQMDVGMCNPQQQMDVGMCNPQQQMDVGMCNPQQQMDVGMCNPPQQMGVRCNFPQQMSGIGFNSPAMVNHNFSVADMLQAINIHNMKFGMNN